MLLFFCFFLVPSVSFASFASYCSMGHVIGIPKGEYVFAYELTQTDLLILDDNSQSNIFEGLGTTINMLHYVPF